MTQIRLGWDRMSLLFRVLTFLVLNACAPAFVLPPSAPAPEGLGSISGTVRGPEAGQLLARVLVHLEGPVSQATLTDIQGEYRFTALPSGQYRVRAELPGYYIYPLGPRGTSSELVLEEDLVLDHQALVWNLDGGVARSIQEIQGPGHLSPWQGQTVTHVVGVVTGVELMTYFALDFPWYDVYIQSPFPDGDSRTSEGIKLHIPLRDTAFSLEPGTLLWVHSGVVEENRNDYPFLDYGYSGNLSRTQIRTGVENLEILATGLALPDPVVIGVWNPDGQPFRRIIPPRAAEESGQVESSDWPFLPGRQAVDFWESLESMRVRVENAWVIEGTSRFGDTFVAPDNGLGIRQPSSQGGGLYLRYEEPVVRAIQIQSYAVAPTLLGTGGRYPWIEGIVDYSRNSYMIRATEAAPGSGGIVNQETTLLKGDENHLTVGTMNVQNFWADDSKAPGLGQRIRQNLARPDIMALVEIQDNNGVTDDGQVEADQTMAALIAGIGGDPAYDYRQVSPRNNDNGGAPGSNIRPVLLFNPERITFVDRSPGALDPAVTAVTIQDSPEGPRLSWSPGLIGAGDPLWENTRKALVGEFLFQGERVFVVSVHLNSKIGDGPLLGPEQPPQRPSEVKRNQRAHYIADFVARILLLDPEARIVLAGDFNDYQFSATLGAFLDRGLVNLYDLTSPGERYSYIHLGHSQALDHVLVSPALLDGAQLDIVRLFRNIPFAEDQVLSDHEPLVSRLRIREP